MITKKALIAAALASSVLITGCNTVAGVGKDVTAVGKGVSHVAYEVRDEVFGKPGPKPTAYAVAGEPCDPNPSELRGGSGLPPCPSSNTGRQSIMVEPVQ